MGNLRVAYTPDLTCGQPTEYELEHVLDYYPYGKILRQFVNDDGPEKHLTTQHERDQETGLDYRGARYYDSDVARFLSLDPLAADYASWNPYNYVLGNPISLIDPDGRKIVFAEGVSEQFKKNFAAAVQRLNKAGAAGLLAKLEKSETVFTLTEGMLKSSFDSNTNTITWDSQMEVITTNGNLISPETGLIHEADHANRWDTDSEGYTKDMNTVDENYDNLEEKRVIQGSEQEVAKKMGDIKDGEVTREDHDGVGRTVKAGYYKLGTFKN